MTVTHRARNTMEIPSAAGSDGPDTTAGDRSQDWRS